MTEDKNTKMKYQIFEKYNIFMDCKLVHYTRCKSGVDCWFQNEKYLQHRALLYPEFEVFFPDVAWPVDYEPVEGDYVPDHF